MKPILGCCGKTYISPMKTVKHENAHCEDFEIVEYCLSSFFSDDPVPISIKVRCPNGEVYSYRREP